MSTTPASSETRRLAQKYLFPFIMVTVLFFLWGFCHAMLDVLNKHFQNILHVSKMQSGLIQTAVYMGYFLMALPAGLLMKRFGYKGGILIGLGLVAVGAFLFVPAANTFKTFEAFLIALFILACGLTCLETAANPYVTILGPKKTSESRLVLSQSFNAVGWIVGPMVGGFLIFGAKSPAEGQEVSFDSLLGPYVTLGITVLVVWVIFAFLKLPDADEGADAHGVPAAGETGQTPSSKPLIRRPHFTFGVLAQFMYVGGQCAINAFAINYILDNKPGTTEKDASFLLSIGMLCFAVGRFSGSALLRAFSPGRMLAIYGIANTVIMALVMMNVKNVSWMILLTSWFFMSIMFPTIFAVSLRGLGDKTKVAASFLVMSIVGGALTPPLMGWIADRFGMAPCFIVPLVCFAYVAVYGLSYQRLLARSNAPAGT